MKISLCIGQHKKNFIIWICSQIWTVLFLFQKRMFPNFLKWTVKEKIKGGKLITLDLDHDPWK